MADLLIRIPRDPSWPADTLLELRIGSEDALSLAASTPTLGKPVLTVPAWANGGTQKGEQMGLGAGELGQGGLGGPEYPRAVLRHSYTPVKAVCRLPVGVYALDGAGNRSGLLETLLELNDAPEGARRPAASPGTSSGEITLSWQRGKDS